MNIHGCAIWIHSSYSSNANFLTNTTFFAVSQCRDFSLQYHSAEDEKMPMMCYHLRSCVPKLVKRFLQSTHRCSSMVVFTNLFPRSECPLEKNNYIDHRWVFNYSLLFTMHCNGGFLIAFPASLESESFKASGLGKLTRQQPAFLALEMFTRHIFLGRLSQDQLQVGALSLISYLERKTISVNLLIVIVGIIYIIAKIIIQSDRANQLWWWSLLFMVIITMMFVSFDNIDDLTVRKYNIKETTLITTIGTIWR